LNAAEAIVATDNTSHQIIHALITCLSLQEGERILSSRPRIEISVHGGSEKKLGPLIACILITPWESFSWK
jgi:hypothetical protein